MHGCLVRGNKSHTGAIIGEYRHGSTRRWSLQPNSGLICVEMRSRGQHNGSRSTVTNEEFVLLDELAGSSLRLLSLRPNRARAEGLTIEPGVSGFPTMSRL